MALVKTANGIELPKVRKNGRLVRISVLILAISALLLILISSVKLTPVIKTTKGLVQGSVSYSRNGLEFWQFLGIPYSQPPVGHLKFAPPNPPKSWKGVKQVTSYPPACAQLDLFFTSRPQGQLDCLYLNVFVNVAGGFNQTRARPVLVYIPGGANTFGSNRIYHPEYLMDQNIVVVVFNYRLGPFGFLNLQDVPEAPKGNMGMLDQLMVLKWVQENIANFGGDPNKVTLFGESAGAMATQLHILSPMSQGLFHKALLQSGSILAPFGYNRDQYRFSQHYAKRMGCSTENSSAVWKCFQDADWQTVVNFQHCLMDPLLPKDMFGPTVDDQFLPDSPENILKSGNYSNVPLMIGVNSDEGSIRMGRFDAMPEQLERLDGNWTDYLGNVMILEKPTSAEVATKIRQRYFGNANFLEDVQATKRNLSGLLSDAGFLYPAYKSALYHAKSGTKVYMYHFNYTSKILPGTICGICAPRLDDWLPSELKLFWRCAVDGVLDWIFGGTRTRPRGVGHGEDMYQLWNFLGISHLLESWDANFSQSFVQAIVDFANDTFPFKFRQVEWPRINEHVESAEKDYSLPIMLMNKEKLSRVDFKPVSENIKFWFNLANWEY